MTDWFKSILLGEAGKVIDGWSWLSDEASSVVVNRAVGATRPRPHPWSTFSDYTSWQGLTDRTYLGRHLPPADAPIQPEPKDVSALFRRPEGKQRLSTKSTCLFPTFAQYLTDGFIRSDQNDPRLTTSNHEIDLCPLYGLNPKQTNALRLNSDARGQKGRLKSQFIGEEEYPRFLYPNRDGITDPAFTVLDPPLLPRGTTKPPPPERTVTIFAVGGDRVNSTPFTTMMNTLLLREHNRVAGELERQNPFWDDERVFQTARNIMIPMYIKIVVEQYINHITPLPFSLRANPEVAWTADWNRPNRMTVEFSLLYRWHSLLPDSIEWPGRKIALGEFGFNNQPLLDVGLEAAFAAAAAQPASEIGPLNTGEALLAIEESSINQARKNRITTYNKYREAFGLRPAERFSDISSNPQVVALLESLYNSPDNVEFYPGLFAEDRVPDSPLPGLIMSMVAVDAFSQALTNPLLSKTVFNKETFSQWGLDLIHSTSKLGDILSRQQGASGAKDFEMTQPTWRYGHE